MPASAGRRVITLMPDGQFRLEAGGKTKWRRSKLTVGNVAGNAVAEMHRRTAKARVVDVDGIGPVRLVFDRLNPNG